MQILSAPDIILPPQTERGVVPTLNGCGWMQTELDPYSRAFVEWVPHAPGRILEIGAAYGNAALEAVKHEREILVNDLDDRHLQILMSRTPAAYQKFIKLRPGAFPGEIQLENESLGAVLASRVLHFLDGPDLEKGLRSLFDALMPGGRLFIVVVTPFTSRYFPELYPVFRKRQENGETWPGFFPDVKSHVSAENRPHVPDRVHIFTPEILIPALCRFGFVVEKHSYIARTDFPTEYQLDGREDLGVICKKPE